jgi:hypothetical protein
MLNKTIRKSKKELPVLDIITVSKMDTKSIENISGGKNAFLFFDTNETFPTTTIKMKR